jgi:hypothetical protein
VGAEELLHINIPDEFNSNFTECLKPVNYTKNLDYIIEFEGEVRKSLLSSLKELD